MQLSDIAVVVTACKRPYYLEETLASWRQVRGIDQVRLFAVQLGRSDREQEQLSVIRDGLPNAVIWPDDPNWGGAMHRGIAEAANRVFSLGAWFAVFGEEDVLVSDDVLEYMLWAANAYEHREDVFCACAHSVGGQGWDVHEPAQDAGADQNAVRLLPYFNAWGWGTWRERWEQVLRPEWDWNGISWQGGSSPNYGDKAGYDWNIQDRVLPRYNGLCTVPDASRSQNIGREEGVYSTAESFSFATAQSFRAHREPGILKVAEEQ